MPAEKKPQPLLNHFPAKALENVKGDKIPFYCSIVMIITIFTRYTYYVLVSDYPSYIVSDSKLAWLLNSFVLMFAAGNVFAATKGYMKYVILSVVIALFVTIIELVSFLKKKSECDDIHFVEGIACSTTSISFELAIISILGITNLLAFADLFSRRHDYKTLEEQKP